MRWICVLVAVGTMAWYIPGAAAQDGLSSEQLRRMYDDAVVQLKTAQDRRNELARENEKLRARIAQLDQLEKELQELRQAQAAANALADKTFQIRAQHAAFQEFLAINPSIRIQWQLFMGKSLPAAPDSSDPLATDWPLPDKLRK